MALDHSLVGVPAGPEERSWAPVAPGDSLVVSIWLPGDGGAAARFQAATEHGAVVIDRGQMEFLAPGDEA